MSNMETINIWEVSCWYFIFVTYYQMSSLHTTLHRDTAVPAEGNGDYQTLICVLVARPRRCLTLSNPVPWQNWMAAYLGYTLRMRTLFCGWPIMVNDTHTRRRRLHIMLHLNTVITAGSQSARSRAAAVHVDLHHSVWLSRRRCRQDTRHVVTCNIGRDILS